MESSIVASAAGAEVGNMSFSQRAEELFTTLAEDDVVSVNPIGLLTVMTSLGLFDSAGVCLKCRRRLHCMSFSPSVV